MFCSLIGIINVTHIEGVRKAPCVYKVIRLYTLVFTRVANKEWAEFKGVEKVQVCWQNRETTVVSDSLQLARCVEYRKHGVRATVKRWCIHAQFIKCVISVLLYKWKLLRGPQEYRQVMTVWSATQWEWHTHTMPRSARLEGLPSTIHAASHRVDQGSTQPLWL